MIPLVHVDGRSRSRIVLYALSTCGWCRKTKRLLEELGIGFDFVDVDLLSGKESIETEEAVRLWNPRCSFPTLVINDERCIVGFDENAIRKLAEG